MPAYGHHKKIQGGSDTTGTICLQISHSLSRSYLNHLVGIGKHSLKEFAHKIKYL